MQFSNSEALVYLSRISDLTSVRLGGLLNRFETLESVFQQSEEDLLTCDWMTSGIAQKILDYPKQQEKIHQELETLEAKGIELLIFGSDAYPEFLTPLADAPALLYAWGDLNRLKEAQLAVVGSRRPTVYGQRAAREFSLEIARDGLVLTSGLARGVDSIAHRAALEISGRTIAVMGAGMLEIYPPENKVLAEEIRNNGGLLLSEFGLYGMPQAHHFPKRNRLISGLALAVFVVEAGEKSGSLITARLAAEQGKDVFALPGSIYSAMSSGTNRILRDGARLVTEPAQILEEIQPQRERIFGKQLPLFPKKEMEPLVLDPLEKTLFDFITPEPIALENILQNARMSTGEISQALLSLELKGAVRALAGKQYVRNI